MHLVKGSDPVVLGERLAALVDDLVGDGDRSLVVEELDADSYGSGDGPADIAPLVNAAQTPPFLTDHRVVVARHVGLFSTADAVAALVDYLASPLPTTALVLVWEKGPQQQKLSPVPKSLAKAVGAVGGVTVDTAPPSQGKARAGWLEEQVAASDVKVDGAARKLLRERLGEDVSRVGSVLRTLEAAYGPGARLGVDEIEPYLGASGGVAPWDLTDAIDGGDIPRALDCLARMMGAGERHALAVMATLHTHYQRMLALDGADVTDEAQAAALLGINAYPARKAMTQSRKLGSAGVREAIALLARADLDLKGASALPAEAVMEILVARLARRSRR